MHAEIEGRSHDVDVVLLHGGLGTGRYHWSRQIGALAARYRVHLPDLPGHGRTPLPADREYGRDLLAGSVAAYLEELGPPAHVLAFSMGGHTSLFLAQTRPERFASLTLVGVSVREHAGLHEWRERFDPDRLEETYPLWARQLSRLHEPQGGPEAWRDVCRRDAGGLAIDVEPGRLGGLRCPVLLLRGDRDPAVDPAQYAELREIWEQADESVIPAGGHDVQLTRHDLVQPVLLDFLDRADA
jgi:3-oxoadipate enol-lactonase